MGLVNVYLRSAFPALLFETLVFRSESLILELEFLTFRVCGNGVLQMQEICAMKIVDAFYTCIKDDLGLFTFVVYFGKEGMNKDTMTYPISGCTSTIVSMHSLSLFHLFPSQNL
jgi:hypothetical protein